MRRWNPLICYILGRVYFDQLPEELEFVLDEAEDKLLLADGDNSAVLAQIRDVTGL